MNTPSAPMQSIMLGRLRINLTHLVWYSYSGDPESEDPNEAAAISIKTVDSESPLSIRYKSFEARDADLALLDKLFDVMRSSVIEGQTIESSYSVSPVDTGTDTLKNYSQNKTKTNNATKKNKKFTLKKNGKSKTKPKAVSKNTTQSDTPVSDNKAQSRGNGSRDAILGQLLKEEPKN
ncbi:MAG: hypothetical protein ACN4GR_17465 [Arenicellales bacterium]